MCIKSIPATKWKNIGCGNCGDQVTGSNGQLTVCFLAFDAIDNAKQTKTKPNDRRQQQRKKLPGFLFAAQRSEAQERDKKTPSRNIESDCVKSAHSLSKSFH